jgi:hypothetical protein
MGVAFHGPTTSAPGGDYLSRSIADHTGAPVLDTGDIGLTSCRRSRIDADASTVRVVASLDATSSRVDHGPDTRARR